MIRPQACTVLIVAALAGCVHQPVLAFRAVVDCVPGQAKVRAVAPTQPVCLAPEAILDDGDIDSAVPGKRPNFPEAVVLQFTPDGQRKFAQFTTTHHHVKIAVIVNGRVVNTPWIEEPIKGARSELLLTPGTRKAVLARFKYPAAP